ncbi:N-formylglutamate amidohydrolase [Rhodoblastus acidophilus]|uniref:N-formylglutamate amidohydrolase n=1 Tax=Rhodoblastus acidophilus TaxID=1074 RepID=UPI00222594D0|nr:N-formylglutamate amidohydrolase [Rhodoblastus acidophilus]MCW2284317.1 N-formylglutamate amidohydrolase [Rhodoblastus acidophilus]MCW2333205.1 N-formylglutamate amidohydrolase [Rhodoblastus acidophilus]
MQAIPPSKDQTRPLPWETAEPDALTSPLVFSSPHSGSFYPPEFLAASRLSPQALRSSEDLGVDTLFAAAPAHGAPLLKAVYPRAYLDVNREADELDPKLFDPPPPLTAKCSLRVAAGLGVAPRVVSEGQAIYAGKIPLSEGLARIDSVYRPYHAELERLAARAAQKFGVAIVIDCHSMPSRMPTGDARRPYEPIAADIVLGDRHGASCDAGFAHRVHAFLTGLGYRVARNKPYAGGFITEHYAARARNRHALQIEINRALYMNEKTLEMLPGFARVRDDMTRLIAAMAAAPVPRALPRQAAE